MDIEYSSVTASCPFLFCTLPRDPILLTEPLFFEVDNGFLERHWFRIYDLRQRLNA